MKVKCESRYGESRSFYKDVGQWYFELGEAEIESTRFGLTSNTGEYSFLDPRGGPMVSVGDKLSAFNSSLPETEIRAIIHAPEKGGYRLVL